MCIFKTWDQLFCIFLAKISVNAKIKTVQVYANSTTNLVIIRTRYCSAKFDFQVCVGIYAKFSKRALIILPSIVNYHCKKASSISKIKANLRLLKREHIICKIVLNIIRKHLEKLFWDD